MISAIIAGRLVRDPQLNTTANGNTVCTTVVACGVNGNKDATEFVRLAMFGKRASTFAQYFHKGDQIFATGSLTHREYKDNKTGENRFSLEFTCDNFEFGAKANSSNNNSAHKEKPPFDTDDVDPMFND